MQFRGDVLMPLINDNEIYYMVSESMMKRRILIGSLSGPNFVIPEER